MSRLRIRTARMAGEDNIIRDIPAFLNLYFRALEGFLVL
jgi:hypothetical protein